VTPSGAERPARPPDAGGAMDGAGRRTDVVVGALLGLAVLVVSAAYAPGVAAVNWVPRVALFYPLVGALLLVWLVARRRSDLSRPDAVDLAVGAFCLWQVVAAVAAPVGSIAWFGAYNRIGGAVWWLAMGAVLVVARRVLARRAALASFVLIVAATLVLAAAVALLQAAGADVWWERGPFSVGRMPGPTGNPVSLGGLGLLAVLCGALALTPGALGRTARWAALAGTAAGLTAVVLSVSRAAYLGLLVGGVTLAVVWGVQRRRRALTWLAAAAAATVLATVLYSPSGIGGLLFERIGNQAAKEGAVAGQVDAKRVAYWRAALSGVRERPLTGYGPGGYVVAFRRFVPADVTQKDPLLGVTDPHGIAFLFAAGSGVVGLALACFLVAAIVVAVVRRIRRARGEDPPGDVPHEDGPRENGPPEDYPPLAAAGAYCLAALAFLLVSPTEPAVVLPLFVAAGLLCPPSGERRLVGAPAPADAGPARPLDGRRGAATAAWAVAVAVVVAATGAAVYLGAGLWRADAAYRVAVDEGDLGMAEAAADRAPRVTRYQVLAGKLALQEAVDAGDAGLLGAGRDRLRRALAVDPTDPAPRVDLAKVALREGDAAAALAEVKTGLEHNPHHPVLQAVWGYAAVMAASGEIDEGREGELRVGLEAYPGKVADAWYWLGVAAATAGDEEAAAAAADEARRLAPGLSPEDYEARLSGGV
jgi:O-antigen ligase